MVVLVTLPIKNCSPPRAIFDTNILICSLFTLLPTDELFQELNFNKYYSSTRLSGDLFLTESWCLNNFFLLINKSLVRQLAYTILQPLLIQENNIQHSQHVNIKNKSIEDQTLKKYLKKFKYLYKLFFVENSFLSKASITDKEINFLAIKILFILIGI
jgi:hypothetical protein